MPKLCGISGTIDGIPNVIIVFRQDFHPHSVFNQVGTRDSLLDDGCRSSFVGLGPGVSIGIGVGRATCSEEEGHENEIVSTPEKSSLTSSFSFSLTEHFS